MKRVLPIVLFCCLPAFPAFAQNLQTNVTFAQSSPLASGAEILRRAFTPLSAGSSQNIVGLPLDVSHETFAVYVPAKKPPSGYALMVFVPPWDKAKMPQGWASVMDDDGVIFVSADQSGNEQPVRTRRMPLALIAAANVIKQYPVDPSRVFVAGFSGGARVALRLALAYPDIFRGAFLNSGSDPIGTPDDPLPPTDLFHQFQTMSNIVYATGDLDQVPSNTARASAASLADFCVAHVSEMTMWNKAHETADESTLSKALDILLAPAQPEDNADCRAKLDAGVQSQLQKVESLIAAGDKAGAKSLLLDIDARYGGLAAPKIVELYLSLQ